MGPRRGGATVVRRGSRARLIGQQGGGVAPPRRRDVTHEVGLLPLHGIARQVQVIGLVDHARLIALCHSTAPKDNRLVSNHLAWGNGAATE